jgi:glutathione synthase
MKFIFLMDPLETVVMNKDTSFILMLGAHISGHEVYFLSNGGIIFQEGRFRFHVTQVVPQRVANKPFIVKGKKVLTDQDVDALFIRTDPPFDNQYLFNTWILDRLASRVPIINHPSGVRTVNEKLWATQFSSLVPPTLVGRNKQDLLAFIGKHRKVVAKPSNGFGGQSVFVIKKGDTNTNVILETLTNGSRVDIILQKYLPASQVGDKRIILLNGEPLGAVLRVHAKGEHRNNFFAGGKPQKAQVTKKDLEIINILKPHLQKLGLYFVGIDIIGNRLIEVNVTSPTCLQEINHLNRERLELKVIDFVEKLVEQNRFRNRIKT